jgi:hypothetical protein
MQRFKQDGNSSINLASQGHYTGVFIGTRVTTRPLPKTFMPSSTQSISRIFSQKEVIVYHYSKGYYRCGPQHTYPCGARYGGPNPTWATRRGDSVGLADFDGAFVLQWRGRRETTPVFIPSMPSAYRGHAVEVVFVDVGEETKSSSEGQHVRLHPNNIININLAYKQIFSNSFSKESRIGFFDFEAISDKEIS